MAESTAERTEQPTWRRLTKAKESGNVPVSMELLSAVSISTLTLTLALAGPALVRWSAWQMKQALSCDIGRLSSPDGFTSLLNEKITESIFATLPFLLPLALAGILAGIAVSGPVLSPKALRFRPDALNPAKGIEKLFSTESLVNLVMSVLKIIFITLIIWSYLSGKLQMLAALHWTWSSESLSAIGSLVLGALIRMCIALAAIGVADLLFQRFKHTKDLRMTRQEVRDEHKNYEGPPEIKRRIRQKQFESAMRRMLHDVPKANVVLVNPTHVAVALKYDPDKMAAPVVVAKGADAACEKIKDVARAYGIPIIRRPALARELFTTVKIGRAVPDALYIAVAEVMALIYRLRRRR